MAQGYIVTSSVATVTTASTVNVGNASGIQDGDIGIMVVAQGTTSSFSVTWPTGWSSVFVSGISGQSFGIAVGIKRLDLTDDSLVNAVTFSEPISGRIVNHLFRNARPYSLFFESSGFVGSDTGTSLSGTAITTTLPYDLGVTFICYRRNAAGTNGGTNWRQVLNTGSAAPARIVTYLYDFDTSAIGTKQICTHTITAAPWLTYTCSLFPRQQRSFIN